VQNALAYIEDAEGYVMIVVDDVPSLLPPQGFSDISTSRNVSIKIMDSGAGSFSGLLLHMILIG
jgi:hypothetical protein